LPHGEGPTPWWWQSLPERGRENVAAAVTRAARYCRLEVTVNGEEIDRADFLAGAAQVEDWKGLRIGVFHEPSRIRVP